MSKSISSSLRVKGRLARVEPTIDPGEAARLRRECLDMAIRSSGDFGSQPSADTILKAARKFAGFVLNGKSHTAATRPARPKPRKRASSGAAKA